MTPLILQPTRCWYCFQPDVLHLRVDKKGAPYQVCMACGARCFFRSAHAIVGAALLPPYIESIAEQMQRDPAHAEQVRTRIDNYRRELLTALRPPPTARADAATSPSASTFADDLTSTASSR